MSFLFLSSIIIFLHTVESAKVLAVFPIPSISHQVVFRPFTQELARRGHDVTVITPDPAFPKDGALENLKEIDVHNVSYLFWSQFYLNITSVIDNGETDRLRMGYEGALKLFEAQMCSDGVQKIFNDNNEKFDLLVLEASMRPATILMVKYKVPVLLFSSYGTHYTLMETLTGPFHPLLHLDINQRRLHNLTTIEEVKALASQYNIFSILKEFEEEETEIGRRLFETRVPMTGQLIKNVDIMFLNVHPLWENIKPVPSSLVYLGGLPQKPLKELPQDLKSYLDSSENGVVYVSFGTNVFISQILKEKRDILINVLSKLPYNVIFKWDDVIPSNTRNIKYGEWFPQSDLLKHPNMKLFITQGGLQSTDEAIAAGVPMIGIPMAGDQWYNVEQYVKYRIGIGLDLETLTEEMLLESIYNIIGNESYRKNIKRFRDLVNDQPQSSLDRAVWWTEYLLRHEGKHFRSPAANMSFAQYLEIDLIFSLISVILVLILLMGIVIKFTAIFLLRKLKEKIKI